MPTASCRAFCERNVEVSTGKERQELHLVGSSSPEEIAEKLLAAEDTNFRLFSYVSKVPLDPCI